MGLKIGRKKVVKWVVPTNGSVSLLLTFSIFWSIIFLCIHFSSSSSFKFLWSSRRVWFWFGWCLSCAERMYDSKGNRSCLPFLCTLVEFHIIYFNNVNYFIAKKEITSSSFLQQPTHEWMDKIIYLFYLSGFNFFYFRSRFSFDC